MNWHTNRRLLIIGVVFSLFIQPLGTTALAQQEVPRPRIKLYKADESPPEWIAMYASLSSRRVFPDEMLEADKTILINAANNLESATIQSKNFHANICEQILQDELVGLSGAIKVADLYKQMEEYEK